MVVPSHPFPRGLDDAPEGTTMDQVSEQRRGRAIAMTASELDAFLAAERVCRVATVGADGRPHVTPLWFVWDGACLWLYSIVRSRRWNDLLRDPRVAVVVDAGIDYHELRGVEVQGRTEVVGDVPFDSVPGPELAEPARLLARKYRGSDTLVPDGRHAWLRIRPEKLVSWDFRKNPALRR
jgi:hypothetical protein